MEQTYANSSMKVAHAEVAD